MPIHFQKKYSEDLFLVVWKIQETLEKLLEMSVLSEFEQMILAEIDIPHKKIQFIIKHLVLQVLSKQAKIENSILNKDENGKPFFSHNSVHISLSHTSIFLGIALHKNQPIGLDLEKPREQLMRIIPRICRPEEVNITNGNLHIATHLWCIKEALYKLYGKRGVDFRTNLLITKNGEKYLGKISMPDQQTEHEIFIEKIEDTYLVLAV
jgi:4'-phosphopantetheinyl transferase